MWANLEYRVDISHASPKKYFMGRNTLAEPENRNLRQNGRKYFSSSQDTLKTLEKGARGAPKPAGRRDTLGRRKTSENLVLSPGSGGHTEKFQPALAITHAAGQKLKTVNPEDATILDFGDFKNEHNLPQDLASKNNLIKYGSLAYKIRSIQNKLQLTEREKDLYSEKSDYYQTKLEELEYRLDNKKFPPEDSAYRNPDLYKQKRSEYKKNKLELEVNENS